MNGASIFILKAARKLYTTCFNTKIYNKPECDKNPDSVAQKIRDALTSEKPSMIARFGSSELYTVINYLGVRSNIKNIKAYIRGNSPAWWWNKNLIDDLHIASGFFPPRVDMIEKFCEMMLQDIPQVDVLGSWRPEERYFEKEMQKCQRVQLELLNPYFSKVPWTKALEGRRVLVVHPYTETIKQQYKNRILLFQNNLLPAFDLKTIKAVQSLVGEKTVFSDWFEALDYMKEEINRTDYDICLIGCGAYGFPLAAHVKQMGKKGFHLGGSLQLLFGIRGKRWENKDYNNVYNYSKLINEHWVKPSEQERPANAQKVEGASYW
jgi:hypothetical protein